MQNRRRNWMLRRIALAFAVAAVAAPTAQAVPLEPGASKAPIPRGSTAPHGSIGAQQYGTSLRMPSEVAANRVNRIEVTVPRGVDKPVLVSDTRSLDWGDAGIGAGLAFAAILLAGAAALSVRQYNRLGQV
jgi:hypothetical protein